MPPLPVLLLKIHLVTVIRIMEQELNCCFCGTVEYCFHVCNKTSAAGCGGLQNNPDPGRMSSVFSLLP